MDGDRRLGVLAHPDQWARCGHRFTSLLEGGGVELTWHETSGPRGPREPREPRVAASATAGLAFDRWGRAYRSRPGPGLIDVLCPEALTVSRADPEVAHPGALSRPRGLAVDAGQLLYVAESGAGAVHVMDLTTGRLRRRFTVRSRRHPRCHPVDVAATGRGAVVLLHDPVAVVRVHDRSGPRPGPRVVRPAFARDSSTLHPTRIAAVGEEPLLLWTGSPDEYDPPVVARADGTVVAVVEGAGDLAAGPDGVLVVARGPGQSLRRFRPGDAGSGPWPELEPLGADDYDAGAVAVTARGRVAVTTRGGVAWAGGVQVGYARRGRVVTYRWDARDYRTRWGRAFLDACVPPGTGVAVRFITTDEDDVLDPLPADPPDRGGHAVPSPDSTPPLPPEHLLHEPPSAQPLYRRASGPEGDWARRSDDDPFATYELPVNAAPGRYLWAVLELTGTGEVTPRVRALRIERPGHRLLGRLPRAWSRDEEDAAFLQRLLAPAEGLLHELDERAAQRDELLDPGAAPARALEWLAGLLGVTLDRRWSEPARRALLAEAFTLHRIRGTQPCLERLLELALDRPVQVVENWRLRGLGGTVLGAAVAGGPAPALGGAPGTGVLGRFIIAGREPGQDGYTAAAHRFTVLVPGRLTADQRDVLDGVVAQHQPAHTVAEICELGAGMRIGRSAHVGLTCLVGRDTRWEPVVLGRDLLGRDLLGRGAVVGAPSSAARLGQTACVGQVRVG